MEGYLWGISPDLLYSFQWGHRIALCLICPGPSILPHQTLHQWNNKRDWAGRRWLRRQVSKTATVSRVADITPYLGACQVGQAGNLGRRVSWHVPLPGGLLQASLSRNHCFYFLRKISETQMHWYYSKSGWPDRKLRVISSFHFVNSVIFLPLKRLWVSLSTMTLYFIEL